MSAAPVRKALIYATSARGVLVFFEPDFPEVPLQVPGGTVDPGETPSDAAQREFHEETGLAPPPLRFLGDEVLIPDFPCPHAALHRHFYHGHFDAAPPATWDHLERHSGETENPILFRFTWLPLAEARIGLGLRLGSHLARLPGDRRIA